MPIYSYATEDGEEIEHICKFEERPEELTLEDGRIARRIFSMPARTRLGWEESTWGVNGKYDVGLGCRISNYKQRDKICKEKGLVPLSDVTSNKYAVEDNAVKMKEKYIADRTPITRSK